MGWKPANGQVWMLGQIIPLQVLVEFVTCKILGTMDTPVEVTLSCHNQEDLDEGPE